MIAALAEFVLLGVLVFGPQVSAPGADATVADATVADGTVADGTAPTVLAATVPAANAKAANARTPARARAAGSSQPNVVVVIADQWSAHHMGGAGDPNLLIEGESLTPTLDALAEEGVRFRRCLTTTPFCTPGRASFLTGLYPQKVGCPRNYRLLDREATGFSEVAKAAGYATGFIGKWHLNIGLPQDEALPGGFVAPGGNRRHGFDEWAAYNSRHAYTQSLFYRHAPVPIRPVPADTYEPVYQTRQAKSWIQTLASEDQPFLLVVSYGPPHGPHDEDDVPPEYWDRIDPQALVPRPNVPDFENGSAWFTEPCETDDREKCWRDYMRGFYAQIAQLDAMIGELIGELEAQGIRDNTIFVFTSDHGEMGGSHGFYYKGTPHLESINVPWILNWPSGIDVPTGQRVRDEWVSNVDIPVTLLGLIGERFPSDVDGRDFAPWLTGKAPQPRGTDIVLSQANLSGQEDRRRAAWLGIPADRTIGGGLGRWRAAHSRNDWVGWLNIDTNEMRALFDLSRDPYQLDNLLGTGRVQEGRLALGINAWRYGANSERVPQCEFPSHTMRGLNGESWREGGRIVTPYLRWFPSSNRDGTLTARHEVFLGYELPATDDDWPHRWVVENVDRVSLTNGELRSGREHFWKVVAIDDEGRRQSSRVFRFSTVQMGSADGIEVTPGVAVEPSPVDGATDIRSSSVLTWESGAGARSHLVYFGVKNPPQLRISTNRQLFRLPELRPATTYYWRVDSVFGRRVTPGPTWSFTTANP